MSGLVLMCAINLGSDPRLSIEIPGKKLTAPVKSLICSRRQFVQKIN